jgi:hypothetical protein
MWYPPKKGTCEYEEWKQSWLYELWTLYRIRITRKKNSKRSFYPPSFNERFKKFIRDIYGNVCFECGSTKEENGKNLDVHHINYNKKSYKCVPLCRSCHNRTKLGRKYWEKRYTDRVKLYWREQFMELPGIIPQTNVKCQNPVKI